MGFSIDFKIATVHTFRYVGVLKEKENYIKSIVVVFFVILRENIFVTGNFNLKWNV